MSREIGTTRRLVSAGQAATHASRRSRRLANNTEMNQMPRKAKDPAEERVMLPPQNEIEVAEPGTSGETVNQKKLREFYELQKEYVELRNRFLAKYAQLQDLIIKGADITQGTYKVQYGVRLVRRPRYKQVVIDLKGEAYQQRVLESTQPHAHFRVKVD